MYLGIIWLINIYLAMNRLKAKKMGVLVAMIWCCFFYELWLAINFGVLGILQRTGQQLQAWGCHFDAIFIVFIYWKYKFCGDILIVIFVLFFKYHMSIIWFNVLFYLFWHESLWIFGSLFTYILRQVLLNFETSYFMYKSCYVMVVLFMQHMKSVLL